MTSEMFLVARSGVVTIVSIVDHRCCISRLTTWKTPPLCAGAACRVSCSCIIPSAELTPSRPGANMHKQIWFIGSYGQRWNIFDKHIVSALKALSIPL